MKFGAIFTNNTLNTDKETLYLVFFRIAIALFLLAHISAIYGDFDYLFGSSSIIPNEVTNFYLDSYDMSLYRWSQYFGWDIDFMFKLSFALFILFALFLLIGLLTQPSALFLLILHISIVKTNLFFNYGMDYFASICLLLLCFLPSNVSFSLDAVLFNKIAQWIKSRLDFHHIRNYLGIFMCIAYFFSGFDKLLGYNWRNGESIWKTLTLPYSNLDFNISLEWLVDYQWIMIVMGWSVILLEMFYFLINYKPFRKFMLTGIVCMHLGIALILNLYFFSAIMIILNLTAYYDFEQQSKGLPTFDILKSQN